MKRVTFNIDANEVVFKRIPGYENYMISNTGMILSCINGKLMSSYINQSGYLRVELTSNDGIRKKYLVHRLVLSVFPDINGNLLRLDSDHNLFSVDHLNKNRSCNCSNNLEIVTQKENLNRRYKNER